MIQTLNHMPMVMLQLHHLHEHLYVNFLHVRCWGDEALGALITVDSASSYMQDAVPTEEQLAERTFEQVRSHQTMVRTQANARANRGVRRHWFELGEWVTMRPRPSPTNLAALFVR
ncbi:hypothetical protein LPJ61_005249 [Coemansia biformis]|uniref:Uncharacterized protein n=1 Tax=Coemansia biformis TaxID=1286918 RepID=A0A9W7Y8N6_9FUNG|nr:hypothetical protein LPJ61_005249 [Coemansia biformis]